MTTFICVRQTHRTVFQIRVNAGRDIQEYSAVANEDEVLLLPGSTFVIEEINKDLEFGVVEVKMRQVETARFALGVKDDAENLEAYASIVEDGDYDFEPYGTYSGLGSNAHSGLDDLYQVMEGNGLAIGGCSGGDGGGFDAVYESSL